MNLPDLPSPNTRSLKIVPPKPVDREALAAEMAAEAADLEAFMNLTKKADFPPSP